MLDCTVLNCVSRSNLRENSYKMEKLSLETLLKAGAHLGHKASRWNPKMAPFIFATRSKFHVIDLEKTYQKIKQAQEFAEKVVKSGGVILFVGTKRQAREIVKKHAERAGMPYAVARWLGGTLTNFKTIQRSIKKLAQLEQLMDSPQVSNYTKKERLMMQREIAKSKILFEGIRELKKLPEAIFVVDVNDDIIAVKEARKMKVPVIGITDTDSDPSLVDYPIPANDDAVKSIDLIAGCIADAVVAARQAAAPVGSGQEKQVTTEGSKHNN